MGEKEVKELGHYNIRLIKEIPDDEFAEQWELFDAEKARRDALESHGKALDEFLTNHRALVGMAQIGQGEEWFEPSDVFDAYPKGAIVEYEGKFYKSKQHANMQPPNLRLWWEETEKPKEVDEEE